MKSKEEQKKKNERRTDKEEYREIKRKKTTTLNKRNAKEICRKLLKTIPQYVKDVGLLLIKFDGKTNHSIFVFNKMSHIKPKNLTQSFFKNLFYPIIIDKASITD